MNFLQELQEQIKNIWSNFNKTQKIIIVSSVFTIFALLTASAFFLGQTKYEPLYPNLDINDSAMIVAKLKDMKTDYRLGEDGTTILVPSAAKHQLRLDLANELPQGGVIGFESFDNARFGETDTDKRVRYLAALQGELTRTVQEMTEVDSAKVHIVLPEPSLFVTEDKDATASVLLKLKPYAKMNSQKVKSIMYFLAHSVEGLSPENVTVIDVYGNLLSERVLEASNTEFLTSRLTTNQMEIKMQYEKELAQSLQTMLEKVKGPGKAVVRTSIEMDFDQVEISTEDFGENVLRSEQISEENSEGTTENVGGVPGTESNLPEATSYQSGSNTNETNTEKSEIIRNYEVDKVIEKRKKAPGTIERISVAVILDGEVTEEERTELQDIIAQAAGINQDDKASLISITGLAFNTETQNILAEQMEQEIARSQTMGYIKYGVIALGIIAALALVTVLLRRSRKIIQPPITQPQTVTDYEKMLQQLAPENQQKIEVQRQIEKIAKNQPDSVAKVIRTWLAEDMR